MKQSEALPHHRERVVAVIPARLRSQRLPQKMLRMLAGKPLIAWTYEAALACPQLDDVIVAVDSEEVADVCRQHSWPYTMTSPQLPSGTDRLHAVSKHVEADLYVNIQGDEPFVQPAHMAALLGPFREQHVDVSTLKVLCHPTEVSDPNTVKVVTAADGRALYFSRASIPYDRQQDGGIAYYKHLGLYAYRRAALERFASLPPSSLEIAEKLEQLRLLENGLAIYVRETAVPTLGVDTEEDLQRAEALLSERLCASHIP